jgi:hypothetical protein
VLGVDFTSRPRPAKPIRVARCRLAGGALELRALESLPRFEDFEALLAEPGPWVGGFDFPFGLPAEAVRALGWPRDWPGLVRHCAALGRTAFAAASAGLRAQRESPHKYPHRRTDVPAGSHSPMKCVNPPVGWMFLEGAPRLLRAGVNVPGLHQGDPRRVALEAYPAMAARALLGRASYKSDERRKQDAARGAARSRLVGGLASGALGMRVAMTPALGRQLRDDGSGDSLDSALCALQAAAAWRLRAANFGIPRGLAPCEGWIAGVPPD